MANIDELYKLTVEIGAKVDGLKSGLNKGKRELNLFGGQVKRIGALIAGAFTISKLSQFTLETIKLAGKAQGVGNAFKRIGNLAILEDLRKATRGTVSDLELMRRTVQASNFQLPIEQLASLFEFASRRAQETGESVDYLVNSIVLGIGRKSPLILDNLGISAVRLRQELKGAGTELTTVADIAAAVGKIANEEMSKMGEIIFTAKDRFEQLTANVQNLRIELGENLLPAAEAVLEVINQLFADSPIRKAGDATEKLVNNLKKLPAENRIAALNTSLFKTTMQLADLMVEKQIIEKQPIFQRDFQRLNEVNKQMRGIRMYLEQFGTFTDAGLFVKDEKRMQNFLKALSGKDINNSIETIKALEAELELIKNIIKETPTSKKGLLATLNQEAEDLEKKIQALNDLRPDELFQVNSKYFQAKEEALKQESIYNELMLQNIETEKEYAKVQSKRYQQYQNDISAYKNAHEELAEVVAKSFASATSSAIMFGENFRDIVKKTIATVIAEAVAFMVGNAIKESSMKGGLAGIILAPIAGAAAGAAAKGALDAAIPSYAGGGVAMNKQLAIVGDNPSGKELMLPLESGILNKLGNQNIHISGTFRQRGRDLVAVINEENKYANQIY